MRVMTWNLFWRFGAAWRERQPRILSTLETVRPDVAGLQEAWGGGGTTQAQQFADTLGMYAAFGAPSLPPPPRPPESADQAGVEVGVAVLSRWPILRAEQHRFPSRHRPEEVVALAVAVDHPEGALHVVASCIDWEYEFAAQRLAQTRALAALLTDPSRDGPLPVLLTADLNSPPGTPEIRVLTDVAVDAWAAANGPDPGHTLSSRNPIAPREAWQIDHRIDYVLARPGTPEHPVSVERAFLAGDSQEGLPPSDHYAVVADLRLDG